MNIFHLYISYSSIFKSTFTFTLLFRVAFLAMKCPANSHYAVCADLCSASCDGLTDIIPCAKSCTEGCECNAGFLFDGEKCVKEAECGCYDNGKTYKVKFKNHYVMVNS